MARFTKENAKEMQRRAAEKRKENHEEDKTIKKIVKSYLSQTKKNSKGEIVTYKEMMMSRLVKDAIENGDLKKIDYLLKIIEEAPKERFDVTTNGQSLTPVLMFSNAPLSEKDMAEIVELQNDRESPK